MKHLYSNITLGDFRKTRLLIRFLCELMNNNVVTRNSYALLLDNLVDQGVNSNVVGYSEWIFNCILSVLPFVYYLILQCRNEFIIENNTAISSLIEKIENKIKGDVNYPLSKSIFIGVYYIILGTIN